MKTSLCSLLIFLYLFPMTLYGINEETELLQEVQDSISPEVKDTYINNLFMIILLIVAVIYVVFWWRKRSFARKCRQPNDYPHSVFNRGLIKYNKELPNDGFILVTGASVEEVKEVLSDDIIESIEEVSSGVVVVKMNRRLEMDEFYYLIYVLNEPLTNTWKGKAVGWITIPFIDTTSPKAIPSMVYMEPDRKGNLLYITTEDNSCWFFSPATYSYQLVPLKQEYRPPSPLKGGL